MSAKSSNKSKFNTNKTISIKFLIFVFSFGCLILAVLGVLFYRSLKQNFKNEINAKLETVTNYNADLIANRLGKYFYNSKPTFTSTAFTNQIDELIRLNQPSAKKEILNILNLEKETNSLEDITLFDTKGNILLSTSTGNNYVSTASFANIKSVLNGSKNFIIDFFICPEDSSIHTSYYLPVTKMDEGRLKVRGVLALDTKLFSSLNLEQFRSGKNSGAELLVVKKDGDSVVLLDGLMINEARAEEFKFPVYGNNLFTSNSMNTGQISVEGNDHLGIPVIAYLKKITGSDWHLVAKTETSAALQPFYESASYIFFFIVLLIPILSYAIYLITKGSNLERNGKPDVHSFKKIINPNFEQYFIHANDMILILDDSYKIVEVNLKAANELGFVREELIGFDVNIKIFNKQLISAETGADNGDLFNSVKEIKLNKKDGTEFYAEVALRRIEADDKIYFLTIMHDISERISAINQAAKLNRALQLISLCNRSLIKAKSETQLIQNICNIVCEKGGYSFAWMGYVVKDEMKHILPNSHSGNGNGFLNSYNFTWSEKTEGNTPEGISIRTNKIYISPDNEATDFAPKWKLEAAKGNLASTIALPITQNAEVIGVLSISSKEKNKFDSPEVVDILEELSHDLSFGIMNIREKENKINTERLLRKSEERYRSFYEEDLTGDFTFATNGRILMCNKSFAKILGFKSISEVKNHNLYDFYVNKDDLRCAIKTIKEKERLENYETTLVGLNGKTIYAFINMIGLYDDNGYLVEITGYLFDVTEIKRAQEQLILAKEKAECANRLKSEFLSQISHEIRTPLNAILSFSKLIEDDLADEVDSELKEGFGILKRAGKRITRTIDSILNLSELHTGGYDYSPRYLDIYKEIIEDLYLEFYTVLKEKNLCFSFDLNTKDTKVFADEYSTKQVFANLIDNAVKFTNKGNINISIERDNSGRLCISVSDTGIGIAEEYLPNLFTPFTQEEQGYTRSFDGNGLGLALVKKYCEVNNIQIDVQSKKGEGTTFKLRFLN